MKNVILVMLRTNPHDHSRYMIRFNELKELTKSLEYKIKEEVMQTKLKPKSNYLIGDGKVKEIKEMVEHLNIDKIIFYNILTSKQKYNLSKTTNCETIDRYDLILEIFDRTSRDKLSKLQIEKARLNKDLPLVKITASNRLKSEHPGARGRGEYSYKSKIRGIQSKITKIDEEIEKYKQLKEVWLENRKKLSMPIICLTGNYNAGKTSLFNLLTDSNKPVSDSPFTTLSSKYQKLTNKDMLFIDTIGFVIDIDPKLIHSFELNLFDIINADIILFLIDISDEFEIMKAKFLSGINVLLDLEIDHRKVIIVFNKMDLVKNEKIQKKIEELIQFFPYKFPHVIISAENSENIESLFIEIENLL
ncbi:MAG: GTPase HflX [Promethearchaeota archaeon]|nr:MAG: GTPase HflX [Candidatus Lokiarchaeota archaeon]